MRPASRSSSFTPLTSVTSPERRLFTHRAGGAPAAVRDSHAWAGVDEGLFNHPGLNERDTISTQDGLFQTGDIGQWNEVGTLNLVERSTSPSSASKPYTNHPRSSPTSASAPPERPHSPPPSLTRTNPTSRTPSGTWMSSSTSSVWTHAHAKGGAYHIAQALERILQTCRRPLRLPTPAHSASPSSTARAPIQPCLCPRDPGRLAWTRAGAQGGA
ncbi:hypothetical protein BJ912DRAFT_959435 [Pholiota molesta]|nr:hypothetical protein BJ912DRAFT_959435 [Pholiota molesta]